ncbi:MAG TPA: molybdopterin cofactor-binding domain-containing protein [Dehalococcoidia bacterium]
MTEAVRTDQEGLRIIGQVAMGFPPRPGSYASVAYNNARPDVQEATWLLVRPDGTAVAYAGKVEYGQGIRSGLAVEVADELRLPLGAVEVVLGDTELVPWDMGTFGSQSTARVGLQLRKAAATAREALLELAAARLDLPVGDLEARDGRVWSRRDASRSVSYGELLAGQQLARDLLDDAPLTPAAEFSIMGRPAQRVDAVARVTGAAVYSYDVLLPGMLFAKVLRPPSYGARLLEVDASVAERLPGVVQVVQEDGLVAVLAESDAQAEQAARLLQARWEERADQPSHLDVPDLLARTAREGYTTQEAGSLEEGFAAADHVLETVYYVPYVSNAPMEPRAAVARWEDGRLTVWAGTQRPFGLRAELAQHFGMDEADVRVIAPEIGGGFGGKSIYTVGLEAARLARAAGRPVRVALTRTEEMMWATFRPAALIQVKSGFTADGTILAWQFTAYHAGERPFIGRRGSECPYHVPHVNVTVYAAESPLRTGSYRSLGGAVNHFARESHVDEIAAAVGMDPVELRLRNLTHPRFRRVLEAAAREFGWSPGKAPSGRGVGAAIGLDVGSYVAECVQVDVQGSEVKVERVAAALDCGLTVNPEGARNQMEGSIVMGLGTALYEAVDFTAGRLQTAGFARYRVPRINNAPAITVALVGDPETPSTGAGEPGIVPIAAAIANAVFDRTGTRVRELPLQRHLR